MVLPEMEKTSIAIVGAGIGGLVLAVALHKRSVPFVLFEEAPRYSAIGAGIGLGPNGLQAMDLIEDRFRPKYESICTGNKTLEDQNVFFEGLLLEAGLGLDQNWVGRSKWGAPGYIRKSAHRKELLDILTEFIPFENVRFSHKLVKVEQRDADVLAHFESGSLVQASVLIGSDGIQSIVRQHVLGTLYPSEVVPVYADSYVYRGVMPISDAEAILGDLTNTAKIYLGNNANCVTYRISGGKEFNFLVALSEPGQPFPVDAAVTQRVTREQMMADFTGRNVDERILRLLDWAQPVRWGLFHHEKTSTYIRDQVALLGDSAHASLPYQAAGAGQGVEDALILAGLLGRAFADKHAGAHEHDLARDIRAALCAYDHVRRPRAQAQLEQSADCARLISFQDAQAGSNMEKILPRLQEGRFDWLWFHDLREDVRVADEKMTSELHGS